jgi:phenylacetic acid degradation operon negative regulatory protein
MKQEGWLETSKHGRQTQHLLTERGRAVVEQGNQRIFEPPASSWNGEWYLVVYSLPEEKRDLRDELRKKLVWYGFGNLGPGTWLSPHNRLPAIETVLDELGVRPYVSLFGARQLAHSPAELVQRCWDLLALAREYEQFVDRYAPEFRALHARLDATGSLGLAPDTCFVQRFWLTYDYQPFPRKDPNLPPELLPAPWVGHAARDLFTRYRQLLGHGMGSFLDDLMG